MKTLIERASGCAEWLDANNLTTTFGIIRELVDEVKRLRKEPTQHDGDCTIYASICNGQPTDGICTCGFGWNQVRKLDCSRMYSAERIHGEKVVNMPIRSEDVDVEQIARMDVAILKANGYFQKKYWPPKMIEIPLENDSVIQCSSGPPVELFWTPTRHHPHENLSYIIVWGYDVRHLHHESNRSSPAYSIYCGPINRWIEEVSENQEKLDQSEKYILDLGQPSPCPLTQTDELETK